MSSNEGPLKGRGKVLEEEFFRKENAKLLANLKTNDTDYLGKLKSIEPEIRKLLGSPEKWRSLLIDYQPPKVERVYTQIGDLRVSLHCIHPCQPTNLLFHPHPWPSAIWVLDGEYEMDVGVGAGVEDPPVAMKLILTAGSRYEMTNIDGWHSVRPLVKPSYSIMINGKPWGRKMPAQPAEPLKPLTKTRATEMLAKFKQLMAK